MADRTDDALTVYPTIQYETVGKAKDAFFDCYMAEGAFDRVESAKMAGLSVEQVNQWFSTPLFIDALEKRLRDMAKRKSGLQEVLVENAANIMDADITDVFMQTENGNLIVRNAKSLPKAFRRAIKKMKLTRRSVNGVMGIEFEECLDIEMHDKVKAMALIGDYTDIKNTRMKRGDTGGAQMVGMQLVMAQPNKGLVNGDNDSGRQDHNGGGAGATEY